MVRRLLSLVLHCFLCMSVHSPIALKHLDVVAFDLSCIGRVCIPPPYCSCCSELGDAPVNAVWVRRLFLPFSKEQNNSDSANSQSQAPSEGSWDSVFCPVSNWTCPPAVFASADSLISFSVSLLTSTWTDLPCTWQWRIWLYYFLRWMMWLKCSIWVGYKSLEEMESLYLLLLVFVLCVYFISTNGNQCFARSSSKVRLLTFWRKPGKLFQKENTLFVKVLQKQNILLSDWCNSVSSLQ